MDKIAGMQEWKEPEGIGKCMRMTKRKRKSSEKKHISCQGKSKEGKGKEGKSKEEQN